jgi:UDP-N-acetyl-D-mannosaminuronic acid dehydrogenase
LEKVSVLGLGYIGLPTGIVAAEYGLEVAGFDINEARVIAINSGDAQIVEPDIDRKLKSVLTTKKFYATASLEEAVFFIIAVPTPFTDEKKADLSYVFSAARFIVPVLKKGSVVILESTVPVGTTQEVASFFERETGWKVGVDFFVAHCPERVLPGKIFKELIYNARIIGGMTPACVMQAKRFYTYFVQGSLYLTDAATAEMVKLVENSSRDVAIAFANQVASMSTAAGLNPYEVIELANKHPRVNILQPGCGVGGHCIAVDPWFLVQTFSSHASLLKKAREVNESKPYEVIDTIKKTINTMGVSNPTVLVLGLTYKPNVDDMRESPALFIAQQLNGLSNINLLVAEPHVPTHLLKSSFKETQLVDFATGMQCADLVICLVAHAQFSSIARIKNSRSRVLDFCGLTYVAPAQEILFWPASNAVAWSSNLSKEYEGI